MSRAELWSLSVRYARTVDRRDSEGFLDVFLPDAVLTMHVPAGAGASTTYRGRDDLTRIPVRMAERYLATFHHLGQADYDVSGHAAEGEVYCVAHHLMGGPEEFTDYVMHIRYGDRYSLSGSRWYIAERRVQVDWTETRPAHPPGARGGG